MNVGVERQGAVLYVEGEGVDVKVTGADHPDWESVVQHPSAVQVHVRDYGGSVFIHAVNQSRGHNWLWHQNRGIRLYSQFIDDNVWSPKFCPGKGNLVRPTLDGIPSDKLILPPLR